MKKNHEKSDLKTLQVSRKVWLEVSHLSTDKECTRSEVVEMLLKVWKEKHA